LIDWQIIRIVDEYRDQEAQFFVKLADASVEVEGSDAVEIRSVKGF
jgi:hypothetical protein